MPVSKPPSREPLKADWVPVSMSWLLENEFPLWHEAQFCAANTACPLSADAVKVPFAARFGLRGVCPGVRDET